MYRITVDLTIKAVLKIIAEVKIKAGSKIRAVIEREKALMVARRQARRLKGSKFVNKRLIILKIQLISV